MELGIAGKRALVTAGSRGIGRACVRTLAEAGAKIVTCARGRDDLASVLDEIGGAQAGHYAFAMDLTEPGAPTDLATRTLAECGEVDILVHNFGGTLGVTDPMSSLDEWRAVYRANFEVALEINLQMVGAMVERRWGRVVHVSSNAAIEHQASLPYSTAKAALTAYARTMGRTLAASGVVMTAVLPGVVMTQGGQWEHALKRDPAYVERFLAERVPRGEFGTSQEVADFVVFLCSQLASSCAGGLFQIDGGQGRSFFG